MNEVKHLCVGRHIEECSKWNFVNSRKLEVNQLPTNSEAVVALSGWINCGRLVW